MTTPTTKDRLFAWFIIALIGLLLIRSPWAFQVKFPFLALVLLALIVIDLVYAKLIEIQLRESRLRRTGEIETVSFSAIVRGKIVTVYVGVGWVELWSGSPNNPVLEFATAEVSDIRIVGEYRYFLKLIKAPSIRIVQQGKSEFLKLTPLRTRRSQLITFSDKETVNAIVTKFYRDNAHPKPLSDQQ